MQEKDKASIPLRVPLRVPLAIFGAGGRMGMALLLEAEKDSRVGEVLAIFSPRQIASRQIAQRAENKPDSPLDSLRSFSKARASLAAEEAIRLASAGGAAIDFTPPTAALRHALLASQFGCPFICGTTGFSDTEMAELRQISAASAGSAGSAGCALVYAANFSLSVALLASLVKRAASHLPSSNFDAEIMEMHHREKVDSPSGTALRLGEAIALGRGEEQQTRPQSDRSGLRARGSVGYGVLRGGGIVGEHRVLFAADNERLTLSHESFSRSIFAQGALESAFWALKQKSGFYSINDVLENSPASKN